MKQWAAPETVTVEVAEVDLTVGGKYHIRMRGEDGEEFNVVGTYREIDRPRRLSYTWQWQEPEHDVGETLVTVEFNDLGGSTEIVLVHELFPDAESKGHHEQGWGSCLDRFEAMFA